MFRAMFSEANGQPSSIRLSMFIVVVAACAIAVYATMTEKLSLEAIGLVTAMLGVGMGAKAVQKFAESKDASVEPPKV